MIRTLRQMFWADKFIRESKANEGNHLSGYAGIPQSDFKDVYEGLIEAGLIARIPTGGSKLTSNGWDFDGYLMQARLYEDYPKLMQAFTYHNDQDFVNPDQDRIAEGEDDERNFRSIHQGKEIRTYSKRLTRLGSSDIDISDTGPIIFPIPPASAKKHKVRASIKNAGIWIVKNAWSIIIGLLILYLAKRFLHIG